MPQLPVLSGKAIVVILEKIFGFEKVRRKGSHIVLRKFIEGQKIVTIVPDHKEVKRRTLSSILKLAHISIEEFLEKFKH
jgi:predicted RNA binding protein YcfA (HicA-like mRNA interferase family)